MKARKLSFSRSIVWWKSMCSLSMLLTTAIVGDSSKKLPSLSSASATRNSPWPVLALVPSICTRPPITMVGSNPAVLNTVAIIDVVVVLPWLPATATPNFMRISSASISARGITGIWRRRASSTSGLEYLTAVEITTTEGWAARLSS